MPSSGPVKNRGPLDGLHNLRVGTYGTGDNAFDLDPTRDSPLVWDSEAKRVVGATPADFERLLASFRPTYGLSSGWVTTEEMRLSGSGEDEADELEAAIAELTERKLGLLLSPTPFGIGVGRTINVTCPIIGLGYGRSAGVARSWIKALITERDANDRLQPVLRVDPALSGAYLAGFGIGLDVASPVDAAQCVGLQWGRPGGNPDLEDVPNGELDIHVFGCAEGVWAMGENNTLRIRTDNCGLSLRAAQLSGGVLDLVSINAMQALELADTTALNFLRWLDVTAYGSLASVINGGGNLSIGLYKASQQGRVGTPWLRVGTVSRVTNFSILTGSVTGPAEGTAPIELDDVDSWDINVRFETSTNRRSIATTDKTRHRRSRFPRVSFGYPTAAVTEPHPVALNLFPNRFMEGRRFGDAVALPTNATAADETGIVRTPTRALRITAAAGTPFNRYDLILTNPDLIAMLIGRQVTLAAWVYVPDQAAFAEATPTAVARLHLTCNGASSFEVKSPSTAAPVRGQFNFMSVTTTVPAGTTTLQLAFSVNDSATLAGGAEFIVVDEVVLALGDCAQSIYEGRVEQSPYATGRIEAGKLILRLPAATQALYEASVNQVPAIGDVTFYTDAAAGATAGRQFTSTGWKNLPSLGA